MMEALKQVNYKPLSMEKEVIELYAVKKRYLDDLPLSEVSSFLEDLFTYISSNHKEIVDELEEKKTFSDELSASLDKAIEDYKSMRSEA